MKTLTATLIIAVSMIAIPAHAGILDVSNTHSQNGTDSYMQGHLGYSPVDSGSTASSGGGSSSGSIVTPEQVREINLMFRINRIFEENGLTRGDFMRFWKLYKALENE